MGSTQSEFYDTTDVPGGIEGNRNWMSYLPDDALITSLSIPGTHNTCGLWGGDMYQCQSWGLRHQYLAGIRFVDIRCRHMYNSLVVYYGRCHQKMNFDDVLRCTLDFLDENQSEFIIMRVQEEHHSEYASRPFSESFSACLTVHGRNRFWTSNAPLSLRQARNKIILIADTDYLGVPTLKNISVHRYETFKLSYRAKWNRIVRHINSAAVHGRSRGTLFVTFCNGFSYFSYAYSVAWRINKYLYDFLQDRRMCRTLGVIVMDFPGVDLINHIIGQNQGLSWRNQDYNL